MIRPWLSIRKRNSRVTTTILTLSANLHHVPWLVANITNGATIEGSPSALDLTRGARIARPAEFLTETLGNPAFELWLVWQFGVA